MITVREIQNGGFTDLTIVGMPDAPSVELDVKEAAELFAALGKVLGGLAREIGQTWETPLPGGDLAFVGTENTSEHRGQAFLGIRDSHSAYFATDQATATAAALIFHSAGE